MSKEPDVKLLSAAPHGDVLSRKVVLKLDWLGCLRRVGNATGFVFLC